MVATAAYMIPVADKDIQPEARGSAEETQTTPLESTQNRRKIEPTSSQNPPGIDPKSSQ
jgi:hypothetical protein